MKIQGTALIKTKTLQQQHNPSFLELASARGSLPPLCSQSVSVKPKLTGLLFSQLLSFLNLHKPVLLSPLVVLDKQMRKVKLGPQGPRLLTCWCHES